MSADISYAGQSYWKIVRRVHQNKTNANIVPIAIFELRSMLPSTPSQAVRRRVQSFISKHHDELPPNSPFGGGGRRA